MEDKTEMYKPGAQTVESPEKVLFSNSTGVMFYFLHCGTNSEAGNGTAERPICKQPNPLCFHHLQATCKE